LLRTPIVSSGVGRVVAVLEPGPPTVVGLLTTWTSAPVLDAMMVLLTVGYLWTASRAGVAGFRWPLRRTLSWFGAVLGLVLAVNSSMAVYAHVLFGVHMIQHLTLIMIVPVLLVWAQPLRLLATAGPPGVRSGVEAVLRGRAGRAVSAPPVALALYAAVLVVTHLTGFQALMLTSPWLHDAEVALYLLSGYLFFLPLAGSERTPWQVPYLLRLAILAVAMGVDTLVGIVLMLTPAAVAPGFDIGHPGWGPGVLPDQELAGAIMWVGGDGLMMLLMIVIGVRWGLAAPGEQTMGRWLEGARARTLLGTDTSDGAGVDDDDQALATYNARLAALHGIAPVSTPDDVRPAAE
jgi:putative copper resistance protein D